MKTHWAYFGLFIATVVLSTHHANADTVRISRQSTFNLGTEGWTVSGPGTATTQWLAVPHSSWISDTFGVLQITSTANQFTLTPPSNLLQTVLDLNAAAAGYPDGYPDSAFPYHQYSYQLATYLNLKFFEPDNPPSPLLVKTMKLSLTYAPGSAPHHDDPQTVYPTGNKVIVGQRQAVAANSGYGPFAVVDGAPDVSSFALTFTGYHRVEIENIGVSLTVTEITPEPTSMCLAGIGLVAFSMVAANQRRRRNRTPIGRRESRSSARNT